MDQMTEVGQPLVEAAAEAFVQPPEPPSPAPMEPQPAPPAAAPQGPVQFRCVCGMVLTSDFPPGTQVQCPGCGQIVAVPGAGEAVAPASGLQALFKPPLLYVGIGVIGVVFALLIVVAALSKGGPKQPPPTAAPAANAAATPGSAVPGQPAAPPQVAAQPTAEQLAAEMAKQVEDLCAKLGSDEYADRSDAKEALVRMRRPALQGLVFTLRSGNLKARCAAADALGEIGEFSALEPLKDSLRSDSEPKVRGACASALGDMHERSAVDALISALSDADPDVRYKVNEALVRLTDNTMPETDTKLDTDPQACQKLWADWWTKNRTRLMEEQEKAAAKAKAEQERLAAQAEAAKKAAAPAPGATAPAAAKASAPTGPPGTVPKPGVPPAPAPTAPPAAAPAAPAPAGAAPKLGAPPPALPAPVLPPPPPAPAPAK